MTIIEFRSLASHDDASDLDDTLSPYVSGADLDCDGWRAELRADYARDDARRPLVFRTVGK